MICCPLKNSNPLRLLAGWCGLLLYVGAFSPIGVGAVALVGTLDPDHHAIAQQGADGMRLILHHEGKCSRHHHGAVARALTVFAQPPSSTDPDHVLQFSSTTGFTRDSQLLVPAANQSELLAVVFAEAVSFTAPKPSQFVPPQNPPPGEAGNLLCLRSTLLLI